MFRNRQVFSECLCTALDAGFGLCRVGVCRVLAMKAR